MKKSLLSRRPLCVLIIFAFVFAAYGVFMLVCGDSQTVYVNYPKGNKVESTQVSFGEYGREKNSDIIKVSSVKMLDGYAKVKIKAVSDGDDNLSVKITSVNEDTQSRREDVKYTAVKVRLGGIIVSSAYNHFYIVLSLLSLLITVYYIYCFADAVKKKRFSYDTLFFLSVVLFFIMILFVWGGASLYSFLQYHTTSTEMVYSVNRNFMTFLTIGTLPLMAVFVLSLTVSNAVLIKKEGFRPSNSLGIITSFIMLFGIGVIMLLYRFRGNTDSKLISVAYAVVSSLYVLFEILLTSSIIYGIYASKYTPAYDKDYIIILGCKIKSDGTLYPLIRGRVDRAIEFYNKQLAETGMAACFVPSGGQGSDEIISEGEAMKNYLLEKGIPEENILPETKSATTKENMRFSKGIIDGRTENAKIVFSTTSYHVFRSGAIAYSEGINIDGIGSRTKWYFWPNAFLREVAGIMVSHPKKQLAVTLIIALSAGLGSFLYSLVS